jgi:hypothetical protein
LWQKSESGLLTRKLLANKHFQAGCTSSVASCKSPRDNKLVTSQLKALMLPEKPLMENIFPCWNFICGVTHPPHPARTALKLFFIPALACNPLSKRPPSELFTGYTVSFISPETISNIRRPTILLPPIFPCQRSKLSRQQPNLIAKPHNPMGILDFQEISPIGLTSSC